MLHTLSHQWPTPSQLAGTEVESRQKYFDVIARKEVLKVKPSSKEMSK